MNVPPVVALMTTYPPRYEMAVRAMKKMSKQVDHLYCYVNGNGRNHEHPDWRKRTPSNVTTLLASEEVGNIGDVGKFYPLKYVSGKAHVLLIDDDIRYPDDYAETMGSWVERFDREHVVGVHACDLPERNVDSYYDEGQLNKVHFAEPLEEPRVVHLLGTGTVAFWSERIHIRISDFFAQNMSDIYFARYCQRKEIAMIAVPRQRGWIRSYATPDDGIWGRFQGKDKTQTWLINQTQWRHHAHISEPS